MPSMDEILAGILGGTEKVASQEESGQGEGELDVAAFVDGLGKTASALEKTAETLVSSPALVAEQLAMLDNPLSVSRSRVHAQNRGYFASVFAESAASEPVPQVLDEIQKVASDAPSGSWLLSKLRRV